MNFVQFLFDTSSYAARWTCGHWSALMGWTHIVSDYLIFLAYTGIPISILYFKNKINLQGFNYVFYLFASFIFLCGATHLVDSIIFWYPIYNFGGILKALSALVSLITLLFLIVKLPETLKYLQDKIKIDAIKAEVEKMKELNKSLENFAYFASHDLQQPVRNMKALTKLIKQDVGDNQSLIKYVDLMETSATRLLLIIKELMNLAHLSQKDFTSEPCKLSEVVDIALSNLGDFFAKDNAILEVKQPEVILYVNKSVFSLVFQNLISNSLKYKDSKQLRITISASHNSSEGTVILYSDNGLGIEPDLQEKVFQPAFRGAWNEAIGGVGLGLAICQAIVQKHLGRISIEQKEGPGATFKIELPSQAQRAKYLKKT